MRRIVIIAVLLVASVSVAHAQAISGQTYELVVQGSGVPIGTCNGLIGYINYDTGVTYRCNNTSHLWEPNGANYNMGTVSTAQQAALDAKEATANKGAVNGYASLDGATKIPIAQIPTGSTSSTVAIGNDSRLSDSRAPNGSAGGDLAGSYPNPTIKASASLTTPNINIATGTSLAVTGAVTSSSATAGVGYATGAGGTVTQITSKSTGVTLNKISGAITTHNAALAAGVEVKFTVTNSTVAATDVPMVAIKSGGTSGSYLIDVTAVAAGSFDITISNASAGSLSEALVINFVILKGVAN